MSTNRLFTLSIALVIVAAIAFTTQSFLLAPERTYQESTDQILRDYDLGERYGEMPQNTAEQILHEYLLGERYGETPESITGFSAQQTLREYWLGERYGVTP